MSGSRLTRKVTVEGSKKISDGNAPRKSVFDRLGPGTAERTQPRREDHHESQHEKCFNWLRDGRCPYGGKCRYDHGSTSETKSKVKVIRSVVSKTDETVDVKSESRVKRVQTPDESSAEHSPKKISKKHKSEKMKTTKEYFREGKRNKVPREQCKDKDDTKVEKRKEVSESPVRRSLSSSGWNLQDQSESDEGHDGKQLDWEERGALNYEREVALEERRNDLRRQIAKIDKNVEPILTIPNKGDVPIVHSHVTRVEQEPSLPFHGDDVKPEKKKKAKSEKSKKKSKKKSHKNDSSHLQFEPFKTESESSDKTKKVKSPVLGRKKKKHDSRNESESKIISTEVALKKQEYHKEVHQQDYGQAKREADVPILTPLKDQKSKSGPSNEPRREKDSRQPHLEQYEKRFEDIPRLDPESDRKRQKEVKVNISVMNDDGRSKEKDHVKKKSQPWTPSYEGKEISRREEQVTEAGKEVRKSASRSSLVNQKESKRRPKLNEKTNNTTASSIPPEEDWSKVKKHGARKEKERGPRAPSPDTKQRSTESRNFDSRRDIPGGTSVKPRKPGHETGTGELSGSSKSTGSGVRHCSSEILIPKPPQLPIIEKQVKGDASENISESSETESSSSEESAGCEVESVSGEEQRNEGNGVSSRSRDLQERKTEPYAPESKQEHRSERREDAVRQRVAYSEHEEHPLDEHRERSFNERRERLSEYDRREERVEKYHRERPRDHRRPREDETERHVEVRSQKDAREIRDSRDIRDHRDTRDYRELPRIDNRDHRDRDRDRERYRELDERERERYPVDVRRNDGPPKTRDYGEHASYGRGGWARDRPPRMHGTYSPYEGRGREYDERRTEARPVQDYERNYDRDRGHPGRGSRYKEVNERHGGPWRDRSPERNYREPEREKERERERYPESRERFHEEARSARPKRPPRSSPEGNRNDRRGYREEQERRPCTPPDESEEWDYEEGHSPVTQIKDPPVVSRKRSKEQSSPRSPRPEALKRKKVASPEPVSQDPPSTKENIPVPLHGQVIRLDENEKEHGKDSKKSRKDRSKKTKKRKLSENEEETTEDVDTPEHKRKRETEETSREKQAKKPKSKNQPEVVVRPWSDLENDDEDIKGQKGGEEGSGERTTQGGGEAEATVDSVDENKSGDHVFSDWSDASEDAVLNKVDIAEPCEVKDSVADLRRDDKEEKPSEPTNADASFEDVYDPISDDEFEAMFGGDENETVLKKKTAPLPVDEVDWSILSSSLAKKESDPGDYIRRFSSGNLFSRIGLSSSLAGPALTKLVQEKCCQDAPDMNMKDLLDKPMGKKSTLGALVAAEARKIKDRTNVVNDIGPCRRALCARRDFNIRKQLRKLTSTKLGAKLVLSNSAVEPVDSELFAMSVALYQRQKHGSKKELQIQSPLQPESSNVIVC